MSIYCLWLKRMSMLTSPNFYSTNLSLSLVINLHNNLTMDYAMSHGSQQVFVDVKNCLLLVYLSLEINPKVNPPIRAP